VLRQSSREFKGRFAGVGYSEVDIGTTATLRPACLKISVANSAQLTSGAPLK
jgi:hypothetical protein